MSDYVVSTKGLQLVHKIHRILLKQYNIDISLSSSISIDKLIVACHNIADKELINLANQLVRERRSPEEE